MIIQDQTTTKINIEGTKPIEYVLPRRIFRQAEIMVERKTLIQGVIILRKMIGEQILKIIIIKIIAIHLLLNL